ncbi:cupin domain-containing protein [Agarivorans sp. 1_MG-2023]|uniref:cupin domain-containing protein n=1 Tax=Agarivorans sp. 1_MG-2023 TaxID=3062634 RepID=UPI0026E18A62|nr:cupin domain-containing protein [Agarivorans sp. 1_MG-2023]MDO6764437.1 cupin domain-containing protein [Agarivorans sp. 1_MG-2023]
MLNMDFSQALAINTEQMDWLTSPSAGVLRKPLEREAKESGHVTSVVQYHADSYFPEHPHPMGEEIFVLEGVFSDEQGDYPTGTYIRNPPGSKHSPFSKQGCVIFVKLNQFNANDLEEVRVDTRSTAWLPGIGGLQVMPLHAFEHEHVALVKWPAGEVFQPHSHFGGEEIMVLSGEFKDEHGDYPKHTWLRSPHMSKHHPFVEQDTIILVKTGHLPVEY